jgi:uncharacterized protein (DUF1684 family)
MLAFIGSTRPSHEPLGAQGGRLAGVVGLSIVLVAAVGSTGTDAATATPTPTEEQEVAGFRKQREARLRAPDGWLSLVGLFWLHPGANRFGGAPDDEVRLPAAVPPHAGTLLVDGKAVRASIAPGVPATLDGRRWEAPGPVPLRSDAGDAAPEVIAIGGVTLQVIDRGGRLGARIKDAASPALRAFRGLSFYAVDPAYRVVARLERGAANLKLVVPDASGGRQELESPGRLHFTLLGRALSVDPVRDGPDDDDLLVVFRDATSGRETYGAGRFVRARRAKGASDAAWVVDFNQAYTPPCGFTPYATCPLPPPQNRLPLPIGAGEKAPPAH